MAPRLIEFADAGVKGWRERQSRAQSKMAAKQSEAEMDRRRRMDLIRTVGRLQDSVREATERRDRFITNIAGMRAKLETVEFQALQHGRIHPNAMALTFDIAASEKSLAIAEAGIITAETNLANEVARQAAAAAEAADQDVEEIDAPVVVTKKAARS